MTRILLALALLLLLAGFSTSLFDTRPTSASAAVTAAATHPAAAVTAAAAPYASCPATMTFDIASGRCKTQQTTSRPRQSHCQSGWTKVAGEYGGFVCQRAQRTRVQVGTQRVFSHNTYTRTWVSTGSRRVHVRDRRVWVPPSRSTYPLVPPIRVSNGTTTQRRCSYDPFAGQQCWNVRVPAYRWITTHTVTTPGYYATQPVYEYQPSGYWNRVATPHYTNRPIYETRTTWQTRSARLAACPAGWSTRGNQCERSVLAEPSAQPTLRCPADMRLSFVGSAGSGAGAYECNPITSDGTETSRGDPASDPADDPASDPAADPASDPAADPDPDAAESANLLGTRLASLSDTELAGLGLTRCENGLLSYVACESLPDREWQEDEDTCEDIPSTAYSEYHGGTCVTESDSLVKCTNPNDCNEITVRTYCPAIAELATTEISQQITSRGAESYRVCVFVCDQFAGLPVYVRERILQSPDYSCADTPPAETTTTTTTTTTTSTVPETTVPIGTPPSTPPGRTPPTDTPPTGTLPTVPPTTIPACIAPSRTDLARAAADIGFTSSLRAASPTASGQQHLPGSGEFLMVAPGQGWLASSQPDPTRLNITDSADCLWEPTGAQITWRELVPWNLPDQDGMAKAGAAHLVQQWEALAPLDQMIVRQWHRSAVKSGTTTCSIAELFSSPAQNCAWQLLRPAVFEWSVRFSYATAAPAATASQVPTQITLASGFEWLRSLEEHAADTTSFSPPPVLTHA